VPDLSDRSNLTDEWAEAGGLLEMLARSRPKWWHDADCLEAPAEVSWVPGYSEDQPQAVRIYQGCLMRFECAERATAQRPELDGIFGALTKQDRRKIPAGERAA
jgi:Transcription factor WhiB